MVNILFTLRDASVNVSFYPFICLHSWLELLYLHSALASSCSLRAYPLKLLNLLAVTNSPLEG